MAGRIDPQRVRAMAAAGYSRRAIARELGCSHSYISRILAAHPADPLPPVHIDARADGTVTLRTDGDAAVLGDAVRRALSQSGIAIAEEAAVPLRQPPGLPPDRRRRIGVGALIGGLALGAMLAIGLCSSSGHDAEGIATDTESLDPAVVAPAVEVTQPAAHLEVARTATAAPPTAASPSPAAAASVPPPSPVLDIPTLTLLPQTATEVRVTVDNVVVFAGTLPAYEAVSWDATRRVQVWTTGGNDLLVTVNGYPLGSLSSAIGHPEWDTIDWGWPADWTP